MKSSQIIASPRFTSFVAIDWSGAVGPRQPGIAVALCTNDLRAPKLVRPGHVWSRQGVLDWLTHDLPDDCLVGIDLSISFAFADQGAFFPGWSKSPDSARTLWALVDHMCADEPHLAVSRFVDLPDIAPHFRRPGGRTGAAFGGGMGRLRATELEQRAQGLNPYSNFNLVGAAQVGKSSLTGMRMLNRLSLPVWPIDPLPESGSVIVEIYTSLAAIEAGMPKGRTKIRTPESLDHALASLNTKPHVPLTRYTDHITDAILSSAWLRHVANDPVRWAPTGLDAVKQTEGWTFGIL